MCVGGHYCWRLHWNVRPKSRIETDRPKGGGEYGTMEAPPETVIEFLSSYGNMV